MPAAAHEALGSAAPHVRIGISLATSLSWSILNNTEVPVTET